VKRLVAVLAAAFMIGLSLFARARIDDNGGGSSASGTLRVACIPELIDACNALRDTGAEVIVEAPGATVTRLAAAQPDIDGWLTLDPWPAIADLKAAHATAMPTAAIASSPLQIAAVGERAPVLAAACGGAVGWRCLIEHVNQPWSELGGRSEWGPLRVSVPNPSSAAGLLIYANAIAGYFGRADYATNDFDADFQAWNAGARATFSETPFTRFVQQYPAAYTAVGVTGADARTGLGTKPAAVVDPNPAGRAVVVLAAPRSRNANDLAKRGPLTAALQRSGWTDSPVTSDRTGLPSPGVLLALSGLSERSRTGIQQGRGCDGGQICEGPGRRMPGPSLTTHEGGGTQACATGGRSPPSAEQNAPTAKPSGQAPLTNRVPPRLTQG
jgi:hypothetical protein